MSQNPVARNSPLDRRQIILIASLFLLSVINYVDRAAISTAKEAISSDLQLTESAMGFIFSAFAIGYAIAQVPAGWLADRIGPRIALTAAVGFWSILTSLTGVAWSFASLLAIRFLFGLGEAAIFPGSARVIRNWLFPGQRGRANGALFAGSRIGAAVSYPLLVLFLQQWSWRRGFVFLGVLGLLWAFCWWRWFRNGPMTNDDVGERSAHPERLAGPFVPLKLKTISTMTLLTQYFASNFTNFICLSWMFPYLKSTYHLTNSDAALYSMPPLLLGATSLSIAGFTIDRMYSSRFALWSRRAPAIVGFLLAAIGLIAATQTHSVKMAVFAFTIAIFGADMTVGPSWVVCTDIGGRRTGRLSGAMNMLGSIGAFASANAFPFLHHLTGSSSTYFLVAAGLNLIGLLCWLGLSSLQFSSPSGRPVSILEAV